MQWNLSDPYVWLIIAAALGALEVMTIAFLALPFALGALAAAVFGFVASPTVASQIWVFIICSAVAMALIQYWFRSYRKTRSAVGLRSNIDALRGKVALVTQPIDGMDVPGAAKVGGETWTAVSTDEQPLAIGEKTYIHRVEGVKLIISRQPPASADQT